MTDEKAIEKMVYDQQQGWPLCPRCGERMPDKLTHGALSRHAKGVYICEPAAPMKLSGTGPGTSNRCPTGCWFAYTTEIYGKRRSKMSNIEKFAPRLRTLIDESGITVRSLAKDLNVSVGVLSDWQNGNKTPRGDSIMKLTEYFGVTADYLLGLTDASTIDADIRISCDTTGLSEKAVKILSGMEKSDVEKLSKLIEFYSTIR